MTDPLTDLKAKGMMTAEVEAYQAEYAYSEKHEIVSWRLIKLGHAALLSVCKLAAVKDANEKELGRQLEALTAKHVETVVDLKTQLAAVTAERDAADAHLKYEHGCEPGKSTTPDACWHHWDNRAQKEAGHE